MEYVPGVSLQEKLDRDGPLEVKQVLRIGAQVARGLAAAHARGLVHRDVKPANILLAFPASVSDAKQKRAGEERFAEASLTEESALGGEGYCVKLTDFGLARAAGDASVTQSGMIVGTPQYMAPEQARGEPMDHRGDLFSLGSVLYAMCTGRPPFCASTTMAVLRRVSDDTPRSVKELNPEIPDWLVAIVDKLHAKDPADRFQSANE